MPKGLPGSETRKPDDFEFYLETILEAPRGQRQIWNGHEYIPAWKSGPSANTYPCAGGAAGGCPDGKCGSPAATGGKVSLLWGLGFHIVNDVGGRVFAKSPRDAMRQTLAGFGGSEKK